jgi:hypothetical protein
MCSPAPETYRVWRVRNANPFEVAFTWDVYKSSTGQAGIGVVPPANGGGSGEVFFQTQTETGANTVRVFVNGQQHDVKASSPAVCPTPVG